MESRLWRRKREKGKRWRETRRPREGQSNTDAGETKRQKTNGKTDGGFGSEMEAEEG